MENLKSIINERRSANNFIEGVKIPTEDFNTIFELLRLVRTGQNLQHASFLVITDGDKKEQLRT